MKRILLSLFLISSLVYSQYQILVLHPYNNTDKEYLTDDAVAAINMLYVSGLNQYLSNIKQSQISCSEDSCALEQISNTEYTDVIFSQISSLGEKIIFSSSIINENSIYTNTVTATNLEDMQYAVLRLAKAIAFKESIELVADVDNIMNSEEEDPNRRKSINRVGCSIGYLYPMGDSFNQTDWGEVKSYQQMLKYGVSYYHEFNNNTSLLVEGNYYFPHSGGIDISFLKFSKKTDISPFYGVGLGSHWVLDGGDNPDDHRRSGPTINFQYGAVLYRTYDINVIARAQYLHILNSNVDYGLVFDIGIEWKRRTSDVSVFDIIFGRF